MRQNEKRIICTDIKTNLAAFVVAAVLLLPLATLAQEEPLQPLQGAPALAEDGQYHGLGLIYKDPRTIPGWHKLDTAHLAEAPFLLPSYVSNTTYLPPVGNQGGEGSCVAWATGYYVMTYMEGKARQWNVTQSTHQYSPAYIYNQGRLVQDNGMYFGDAIEIMSALGCASLSQMPYTAGQYTSWPSENAYKEAINYRVDSSTVTWVDTTQAGALTAIKQWLDQGNIGFAGIEVYHNFDYISSYNYNYCLADVSGTDRGGHATTIIGYDDSRVTNDGTGAFRCVNSWGAGWGEAGYYWLSYQAVTDPSNKIFQGFFADFQVKSGAPSYAAVFQITYPQFRDLTVKLAKGTPSINLWSLYSWSYSSSRNQSISAPPNPVWVDISDLTVLPVEGVYSLVATDARNTTKSGQITSFSIVNLSNNQTTVSPDPPVSIPAGGAGTAYVTLCPTMAFTPATLPNGAVGAAYSKTITTNGGTAPYTFALTSGSLPDGLSLSSGGVLSGTPTTAATYNFTVTATDNYGCAQDMPYTIVVTLTPSEVAPGDNWAATQTWIDKNNQTWPANGSATSYRIYRGQIAGLPNLLNSNTDSCERYDGTATNARTADDPRPLPAGDFYWYIVIGVNAHGEGSAGSATAGQRLINSTESCP
jgi:C1A family cysteine protease